MQFAEDRAGQFHCLNLCERNTETPNEASDKTAFHLPVWKRQKWVTLVKLLLIDEVPP